MKTKKHILLLITILSLALLLAACGGSEAEQPTDTGGEKAVAAATNIPVPEATDTPMPEPTDTPEPVPTDTPVTEPADTPEPEEESDISTRNRMEELFDSFRSRGNFGTSIRYANGETEEQSMTFEMEWVNVDNEYGGDMSMVMTGFGHEDEGSFDSMAIYSVGDTMAMNVGGEWMSSPRDPSDFNDMPTMFQNPEDFTDNLDDLDRVGKETVNGFKTVHYRFEDSSFFGMLFSEEDLDPAENLDTVSGDIWVAEDGEWVVKMVYEIEGKDIPDDGDQGDLEFIDMSWEFEVYEVNSIDSIELPDDAPEPGEASVPGFEAGEFPIPADTTMQGGFGGVYVLESALSEEEVNAFYDDELTALGWTKEEGFMPIWSKDGVNITLMIGPGESGGTSIMIMAEEG